MAKAKVYGMRATCPKMSKPLGRQFWQASRQQQLQRQRERTTPKPVAAQIVKEKEGKA